jgi:pyrroline-5-carboxylate reductase
VDDLSVVVGPRNAANAAALAAEFPGVVQQALANQEVLDRSDVVLLATPPGVCPPMAFSRVYNPCAPTGPEQFDAAVGELTFRAEHRIICLVAGVSYDLLQASTAPAGSAVIAMPLPPAQDHASTTVLFPRDEAAEALMQRVGTVCVI